MVMLLPCVSLRVIMACLPVRPWPIQCLQPGRPSPLAVLQGRWTSHATTLLPLTLSCKYLSTVAGSLQLCQEPSCSAVDVVAMGTFCGWLQLISSPSKLSIPPSWLRSQVWDPAMEDCSPGSWKRHGICFPGSDLAVVGGIQW